MRSPKAVLGLALTLAVLAGCQGGDAADAIDATPTAYNATAYYGETSPCPLVATTSDPVAHDAANELEMLVNAHRNALGLDGLRVQPELKDVALAHSVHMGLHDPAFFDHLCPEGYTPWDRVNGRIECTEVGENIAAGQSAAEAVLRSWLDSPGHRAN